MSDSLPLSEPIAYPQPLASSCADTLTKTSPDPLEDNVPSSQSTKLQQCDNQTESELQRPQSSNMSDNLPLPTPITDPPSQPFKGYFRLVHLQILTKTSPDPLEDNFPSSESSQSTNCSAEQPQLCDNQTNPEQTCQLQDEIVPHHHQHNPNASEEAPA